MTPGNTKSGVSDLLSKNGWARHFEEEPLAYAPEGMDVAFLRRFRRSPWIGHIVRYAEIQGGERVLEAGCGGGKFSVVLASLGCRATALDFSWRMAENARRLKEKAEPYLGSLYMNFLQGDLSRLPFKDGSFDVVFNEGVVEHCLDPEERVGAIGEMVRVTKERGSVVVFVPNGGHPLHRWWVARYPSYREAPPMTEYNAKKLTEEMWRAGCREIETDGIGAWSSLAQWPNWRVLRYLFGFANRYIPLPRGLREGWGAHLVGMGKKG